MYYTRFALRDFLGVGLEDAPPDHSTISRTRRLIDLETHRAVFTWVLLPSTFGLAMCHIPNLIWAYKKVTKHYHNFIPTGKTYAVVMYDRHGIPLQMQARQKKIDAILSLLGERAPWAIFGYNDELNQTLKTNWGGFVAAVDARRSSISSSP